MAIEFVGASSNTAQSLSVTINRPGGVTSGDVLVSLVFKENAGAIVAPTGWNVYWDDYWTDSNARQICWRVVENINSEPNSYAWANSPMIAHQISGAILAYRGVSHDHPLDIPSPVTSSGATLPSITTQTNGAVRIAATVGGAASTGGSAAYTPNGMSFRAAIGRYQSIMVDEFIANSGATAPRTWLSGGAFMFQGIQTALRPAGDSPPPPTAKPWTRAFIVE